MQVHFEFSVGCEVILRGAAATVEPLHVSSRCVEVSCVLLATHMPYIHESQNGVVSVREFVTLFFKITCILGHSWLRHCAISQKLAGLIPDGVRIFH